MIKKLYTTLICALLIGGTAQAMDTPNALKTVGSKTAETIIFLKNLILQHPYIASAVGVDALLRLNDSSLLTVIKNFNKKHPALMKMACMAGVEGVLRYHGTTALVPLKKLYLNHPWIMGIVGLGCLLELYQYLDITDKIRAGYHVTTDLIDRVTDLPLIKPIVGRTQFDWIASGLQTLWHYAVEYPTPTLFLLAIPGIPFTATFTREFIQHPKITNLLNKSLKLSADQKLQDWAKISAFYPLLGSFLSAGSIPLTGDPLKKMWDLANGDRSKKFTSSAPKLQWFGKELPAPLEINVKKYENDPETAPRCNVVHGKPGTGKTAAVLKKAERLGATEKNGRVLFLTGAQIFAQEYGGHASAGLLNTVKEFKDKAKADRYHTYVVIIDDGHNLFNDRGKQKTDMQQDNSNTVDVFRQCLDWVKDTPNMILDVTTNFATKAERDPSSVDQAVFSRMEQVVIPDLTEKERTNRLQGFFKKNNCTIDAETLTTIVDATNLFTTRYLEKLVNKICADIKIYDDSYSPTITAKDVLKKRTILDNLYDQCGIIIEDAQTELANIRKLAQNNQGLQNNIDLYTEFRETIHQRQKEIYKMLQPYHIADIKDFLVKNPNLEARITATQKLREEKGHATQTPEQELFSKMMTSLKNSKNAEEFKSFKQLFDMFDVTKSDFKTSLTLQSELLESLIKKLKEMTGNIKNPDKLPLIVHALKNDVLQLQHHLTVKNPKSGLKTVQQPLENYQEQLLQRTLQYVDNIPPQEFLETLLTKLEGLLAEKQIYNARLYRIIGQLADEKNNPQNETFSAKKERLQETINDLSTSFLTTEQIPLEKIINKIDTKQNDTVLSKEAIIEAFTDKPEIKKPLPTENIDEKYQETAFHLSQVIEQPVDKTQIFIKETIDNPEQIDLSNPQQLEKLEHKYNEDFKPLESYIAKYFNYEPNILTSLFYDKTPTLTEDQKHALLSASYCFKNNLDHLDPNFTTEDNVIVDFTHSIMKLDDETQRNSAIQKFIDHNKNNVKVDEQQAIIAKIKTMQRLGNWNAKNPLGSNNMKLDDETQRNSAIQKFIDHNKNNVKVDEQQAIIAKIKTMQRLGNLNAKNPLGSNNQ